LKKEIEEDGTDEFEDELHEEELKTCHSKVTK